MKRPGRTRGYIEDEKDVMIRYTIHLESMIDIAKRYKVSRQTVYYCLKRQGVITSKQEAGNIEVTCCRCGKVIKKKRCQIRDRRQVFCNQKCYYEWLNRENENGKPYIDKARGRLVARAIARAYIGFKPGYTVHHEDRNSGNNNIRNLRVFATPGDHLRYHRGFRVEPIWDGSKI